MTNSMESPPKAQTPKFFLLCPWSNLSDLIIFLSLSSTSAKIFYLVTIPPALLLLTPISSHCTAHRTVHPTRGGGFRVQTPHPTRGTL